MIKSCSGAAAYGDAFPGLPLISLAIDLNA